MASLAALSGRDVLVRGLLHFSFEDVALYQWPVPPGGSTTRLSIWLRVGDGSLGFQRRACERLSGKVVLVEGMLQGPPAGFDGCGHMGLWPADLLARTLVKAP